jgi:hypothetical protein
MAWDIMFGGHRTWKTKENEYTASERRNENENGMKLNLEFTMKLSRQRKD